VRRVGRAAVSILLCWSSYLGAFSDAAVDMVRNMYRQSAHRTNITSLTPVSGENSYNCTSHVKIKAAVAENLVLGVSTRNRHIRENLCYSFWGVKLGSANHFI
jgi:hypothetical protein